jgi:hypothetical protein
MQVSSVMRSLHSYLQESRWKDARIDYSRENPQARVSVSFGTALGGVCNIAKFRKCVPDR